MKRLWGLVAVALVATGCSGEEEPKPKAEPEPISVMGQLMLDPGGVTQAMLDDGTACEGLDADEGDQVVVSVAGKSVAKGEIRAGRIDVVDEQWTCGFRFVLTDVPGGHDLYDIKVGDHEVTVAPDEVGDVVIDGR